MYAQGAAPRRAAAKSLVVIAEQANVVVEQVAAAHAEVGAKQLGNAAAEVSGATRFWEHRKLVGFLNDNMAK